MKMKNEKGITIVALVVTIAILLILAGVTIGTLFGENGIVTKAQEAADKMNEAAAQEQQDMEELLGYLDGTYVPGTTLSGEKVNLQDYTMLNITTYVGHFVRQRADYLGIAIVLTNKNDANDSIRFNLGIDWKEKVDQTNNKNQTFVLDSATKLDLVENKANDKTYVSSSGAKVPRSLLNAFTDAELTVRAKKGIEYNMKLLIKRSTVNNSGVIASSWQEIYSKDIASTQASSQDFAVPKSNVMLGYLFDMDGTGILNLGDASSISSFVTYSGLTTFDIYTDNGTLVEDVVVQTIDERGLPVNADYIGFDLNRDGYITSIDYELVRKATSGSDVY